MYVSSVVLLGDCMEYFHRSLPKPAAVADTSFGRGVSSIDTLSTIGPWATTSILGAKKTTPRRRVAESRPTTDTAAIYFVNVQHVLYVPSYRKSHQTHIRSPKSNHTRNLFSAPCRLCLNLASVRPWTESEAEHIFDGVRVFSRKPKNKPRNLNGVRTESYGHVHVLCDWNVPCPQRYAWSPARGAVPVSYTHLTLPTKA